MNTEVRKRTSINLGPCTSSRIHAHGYDTETKTLALQFKAKGNLPGSVYHYDGVEPETYAELCKAESIGKFFGERINVKNDDGTAQKYPHTKIEPEPVAEDVQ